jgi:type I restriction-modification system DNA methylase subunit
VTGFPQYGIVAPTLIADKSLESSIWDATCSNQGVKDAPKYKDYILPLIFMKQREEVREPDEYVPARFVPSS